MDTSEVYVKMCEKATEIQDWHQDNIQDADFIKDNLGMVYAADESCLAGDIDNYIWLPRQDQLQEMMQPCGYVELIRDFSDFCFRQSYHCSDEGTHNPAVAYLDSMEQLWLAFVMKEKFGKVWNGEDWILTSG